MNKIFSGIMLILLLTGMLGLAFRIQRIEGLEPPMIEWSKTYGGSGNEEAYSVIQTSDGGYAIAGGTTSTSDGRWDFLLVKTDANGNEQWNKTYGDIGSDEMLRSMIMTADGGYALAGALDNPHNADRDDFLLVKTDADGNMQWSKTYGGSQWEFALSVVQTGDGGYALVGPTRSFGAGGMDFWLVKTDANGNMQWSKTFGGSADDYAWCVIQTSDGGYAMTGSTRSFGAGDWDFWLVKTDQNGVLQWTETYGGWFIDGATSVLQTDDGGYVLAGGVASFGAGSSDFWLIRTDLLGNIVWDQNYGGTRDDDAYCVIQTRDGGYALVGKSVSVSAGDDDDFWLVKTDSNGNKEWDRAYGGTDEEIPSSIIQAADGGYVLAGWTKSFGAGGSDFWLIKLAPEEIPATVDIDPNTLNLKSKGKWVTCYIELPEAYDVNGIDVSSIMLNDTIPVDTDGPTLIEDHDGDGVFDLMVKFDRAEVRSYIIANVNMTELYEERFMTITLTITGYLNDDTLFKGSDTVRIISPLSRGLKKLT